MLPRLILFLIGYPIAGGVVIGIFTNPNLQSFYTAASIWLSFFLITAVVTSKLKTRRGRDFFRNKYGEYKESYVLQHIYCYRILYIALPILIAILVGSLLDLFSFLNEYVGYFDFQRLFYLVQMVLLLMSLFALAVLISNLLTKDFSFRLARACINIAQRKPDKVDAVRFFILAMKSYNVYLRRTLGLQIKSLDIIFDGITRISSDETVALLSSLEEATNRDKLDMTAHLAAKFLGDPKKDQLLTTHVYATRLKDILITLLIPGITIIITAIDVFFI